MLPCPTRGRTASTGFESQVVPSAPWYTNERQAFPRQITDQYGFALYGIITNEYLRFPVWILIGNPP